MMSEIMKEFSVRYELGEEGEKELIDMFNKSLLEVSQRILEKYDGKSESSVPKIKSRVTGVNKKFASKKAEEYAHENNLSLDDFDQEKISKKDVEDKVRKQTKEKTNLATNTPNNSTNSSSKKIERKVLCCGLTKKGDQCTRAGTLKPNGAKKMYCFRHADEWNTFECDSDSSDEEELKLEKIQVCQPVTVKSPTKEEKENPISENDSDSE